MRGLVGKTYFNMSTVFSTPLPVRTSLGMAPRKDFAERQKLAIVTACATYADGTTGKLPAGALKEIQRNHGASPTTIKRYWHEYRLQQSQGVISPDLSAKRIGNCGVHNSKLTPELIGVYDELVQKYADMHLWLSNELCSAELWERVDSNGNRWEICPSTVMNHFKVLKSKRVNVRVKPKLDAPHLARRRAHVLSRVDTSHGVNKAQFKDQFDHVHVDES